MVVQESRDRAGGVVIAAARVEALKLTRSLVGLVATAAIIGGTLVLVWGITAALRSGNEEVIAQMGPNAALDWPGLLAIGTQIIAAGGMVGFGVVLTWILGREFTDGTITGLFALPVSRGLIAGAKMGVYAVWVLGVSLALTAGLGLLGAVLGYGAPTPDTWAGLGRLLGLGVLTGAVAVPVAWVATVARSVFAGVGATVGLVVMAQVGVVAGAAGWFPLAAPAMWALDPAHVTGAQLALVMVIPAVFVPLTWISWQRVELDR